MAMVTSQCFSGPFTDPFLSGIMEVFFCTRDAFHNRIRNDSSEQVCVCAPVGACLRLSVCVRLRVLKHLCLKRLVVKASACKSICLQNTWL